MFVAKGRDGTTDIWGIIVRPTNFDPAKKYPVIENIYAGPQGSFVPKTFSAQLGMQSLAELGLHRRADRRHGHGEPLEGVPRRRAGRTSATPGFPDRILWHKAVAAKYPCYDITRVGIYGTSAGGQNAMGARAVPSASSTRSRSPTAAATTTAWTRSGGTSSGWAGRSARTTRRRRTWTTRAKLQGKLLLIVGEMDTNVDPSSTMQVVNALIKANKDFELLAIPNAGHTDGGAYGDHKRFDFFVRDLRGVEPPAW